MPQRLHSLLAHFGALALIMGGLYFLVQQSAPTPQDESVVVETITQVASVDARSVAPPTHATPTLPKQTEVTSPTESIPKTAPAETSVVQKPADNAAFRIKNPYAFPPVPFETVDISARAALVNIFCTPRRSGTLSPISGSGVIIDPRGVILTNAHVAQYVLLSQSSQVNISCVVRSGAPATPRWSAEILYIPPVWVESHAREVAMERPLGTGEHDYALLRITGSTNGTPVPSLPYLPPDTREAIGFSGDSVLVASYPAEFLGASTNSALYPASSVTVIGQLMTFFTRSVDLISLGGIIEAQSGSSGGAVVNAWGRLVALISTTSEGDTTAARDLRAITLSYISRDLAAQMQFDLPTILGGDVAAQALDFNTREAPRLIDLYLAEIYR